MKSAIFLHRSHDDDLMALRESVGIREFGNLLKESIRVLARPGYIPKHKPPSELGDYTGEQDTIRVVVNIESAKDTDIEELLSHVKFRRLGAFCKMAMRFYIGPREVMRSMLDIDLFPVLSYVPKAGHIVASIPPSNIRPVKSRKNTAQENVLANRTQMRAEEPTPILNPIESEKDRNDATIVTAMPTGYMPSRSLDMTMGDTVVVTEPTEDEDDILALLEGLMD